MEAPLAVDFAVLFEELFVPPFDEDFEAPLEEDLAAPLEADLELPLETDLDEAPPRLEDAPPRPEEEPPDDAPPRLEEDFAAPFLAAPLDDELPPKLLLAPFFAAAFLVDVAMLLMIFNGLINFLFENYNRCK